VTVFLLILLVVVFGAWILQRRSFLLQLRSAERIIEEVAAGKKPATVALRRHRDFAGVAWRVEHLSEEHELLKQKFAEKTFNLDAILSSMIEGVLVVSKTHEIRVVNQSFCKMFNVPADALGQTVLRAVREAAVDEIIGETLDRGEVVAREISIATMQGEPRHYSVNSVPVKNPAGVTTDAVVVFHDISRLRQLEEVRREFVANVSHELRTPLSIFHGYLENLMENPKMPRTDIAAILKILSKHSRRLNALLEDLLTLARLESRRDRIDLAELPLRPMVETIAQEWRQKFATKNLSVTINVPDSVKLRADAFRLEQVLGNLLDNAIKFSRDGGTISMRAESQSDAVIVRVEDNGIGIPPADLPHIFERFYRVEKARSREAGGTGLGLSIVKHIVGLHGGNVRAESTFGTGTAIVLEFPATKD